MLVLETSDFKTGFYKVPFTQYTQAALQEAIDQHEERALACLLGVELAELFIADLVNGAPVTQKYIDIFEPFLKEINCIKCRSIGIKDYLKGWIYYEYMRCGNRIATEGGKVSNLKENSQLLNFENNERDAEKRFSASKFAADCIQLFICDNSDIYPEYQGEVLKVNYSSFI